MFSSLFLSAIFLVLCAFAVAENAGTVCKCSDLCSLIPPTTAASSFPCYQGLPDDAAKCFQTDPLLAAGTTWACGNCTAFGYPNYLRNDPLYTKMELWAKDSALIKN